MTGKPEGSQSDGGPGSLADLLAREQLRELIASYTHLGDSGRLDEMVELFEVDATLDAFGETFSGHHEIRGFFSGIVSSRADTPRRTFVRHHISNVTLEVDLASGSATGASYWVVYSDDGFESSGRYRDEYRRSGAGRWRFRMRKIRRDGTRSSTGGPP